MAISRCEYLPESRTRFTCGGTRRPVAQFHAAAQTFERFVGNQIGALDQIGLRDFVIRIGQPLGELRVVGQDQQPAGIEIEPANGGNESIDIGDQIVDCRPAFGIFEGRDVPGGLIEQDVDAAPSTASGLPSNRIRSRSKSIQ